MSFHSRAVHRTRGLVGLSGLVGLPAAGAIVASLLAGCGSTAALSGAEPAVAPPLTRPPAGRVVAVGAGAEGIVADPGLGEVAVAVRDPTRIALIDARTGALTRRVPIAGPARHLALDGTGTLLVPEAPLDRLLELPLRHPTHGADSVRTGSLPHDATAVDGRVFVADEFGHEVSVLTPGRATVQVPGFTQPGGITTVDGNVALVDVGADTVTLINPHTLRLFARVHVGTGLTHDAAGPDGRLYVVDTRGGALFVLGTRPQLHDIGRLGMPGRPYGIAADPGRRRLWVTETATNTLVELSIAAPRPRVIARYPTVRQPNTVAVDPETGEVFVAGAAAGVVQEIHPAG